MYISPTQSFLTPPNHWLIPYVFPLKSHKDDGWFMWAIYSHPRIVFLLLSDMVRAIRSHCLTLSRTFSCKYVSFCLLSNWNVAWNLCRAFWGHLDVLRKQLHKVTWRMLREYFILCWRGWGRNSMPICIGLTRLLFLMRESRNA